MLVKIYALIWILMIAVAGVVFLTDYYSAGAAVVFGLFCFGLLYLGMLIFEYTEYERHV